LELANLARSRIAIGAWRLRKSKRSAAPSVMICRYEVWLAARKNREFDHTTLSSQ
jgi:hypothetical protein